MNAHIAGQSYNDVKDQLTMPSHFESTTRLRNYTDLGQSAPSPPRHGLGNGVLFQDGHVKFLKTVDCSFAPVPLVWVGDTKYPLSTLPNAKAPYDANMQALVWPYRMYQNPDWEISWWNNEMSVYFNRSNVASIKVIKRTLRSLYPKWKQIRQWARVKPTLPYRASVRLDYTGKNRAFYYADKL